MKTLKHLAIMALAVLLSAGSASAITIGSLQRTGTLDSATAGAMANDSNLFASTVNAAFPVVGGWTNAGHLDTSTGLSDLSLTITFTSGTWNSNNVAGTWTIGSSFWTTYADAVIGWHVGNGNGTPNEFMFLVTQGATSGTWSYDRLSGGGGGFSNMQLFGSGTGTQVPDGGATVALLGLALAGIAGVRRKFCV